MFRLLWYLFSCSAIYQLTFRLAYQHPILFCRKMKEAKMNFFSNPSSSFAVTFLSLFGLVAICDCITYKWASPSRSDDGFYISRDNLSLADSTCLRDMLAAHGCSVYGFTFGLKIRPERVPVGQVKFWFTNGGESPYSSGIFLQQEGGEPARFILGVSALEGGGKKAWIREPFFLRLGHWTQIAFTCTIRQGLIVSVDDVVFEDSSQGKKVLYVNYLRKFRSPFSRELMVDVPYPGEVQSATPKVKDIVFYRRKDEMQDVKPVLGELCSFEMCYPLLSRNR